MNALAADWFPERNRLVVVSAPEAARTVLPTESQLAAVVASASAKSLDAYVDAGAGETLMDAPPARGSVTKTTAVDGTGITVWTLSNGATVVLRPTTLKADQILFRAVAPGGTSLATDDNFPSARVADDVIPAGGVGTLSEVVLDKLLSSKALAVRPYISEIREGMEGGSAPQDLEMMFQLLYMRFTQPRADPSAFAAMKAQTLALLVNQTASPDAVYGQALDAVFNGNNPRRQPETPETVAKWNLDASLAFYKARFADASNFTFIFVGSFTPEALKPLVETYLASLPATHKKETWRDLGSCAAHRRDQEDGREGNRAEERSLDHFLGRVRLQRREPAGVADGGHAAAVAAQRRHSRGTGRDLQHRGDVERGQVAEAGISRADQLDLRPRARRQRRAAGVPGDRGRP